MPHQIQADNRLNVKRSRRRWSGLARRKIPWQGIFQIPSIIRSETRLKPSPLGDQVYLRHEPFARYKAARMDYRYGSHIVYKIQYHFVFVTKYRYQVLKRLTKN